MNLVMSYAAYKMATDYHKKSLERAQSSDVVGSAFKTSLNVSSLKEKQLKTYCPKPNWHKNLWKLEAVNDLSGNNENSIKFKAWFDGLCEDLDTYTYKVEKVVDYLSASQFASVNEKQADLEKYANNYVDEILDDYYYYLGKYDKEFLSMIYNDVREGLLEFCRNCISKELFG